MSTEASTDGPLRVTILTNLLPPYRISLFEAIAEQEGVEVSVLCTAENQKNRNWGAESDGFGFSYTVLPGYTTYSYVLDRSMSFNYGTLGTIRSQDPDVLVLGGYSDLTVWLALGYAKLADIPVALWMGSWSESARLTSSPATVLKQLFVRQADAWLAYGTRAAEWLGTLGADPERVHRVTNTVDMEWFHDRAVRSGTPPTGDAPLHLLYCGQLIKRKNVDAVIEAISPLPADDVVLTVVGDGPERERLEAKTAGASPEIRFEGYVDRKNIPRYYGSSDALVLPSRREVWGLVVNEALAGGAAAIVSERCGSVTDLLREGFNGATFDPDRPEELRRLIAECAEQRAELRSRRTEIAADARERASLSKTAAAFIAGVHDAYESHHGGSGQ
jgi:glycosyltransferase involved in cell wall biosynthesis